MFIDSHCHLDMQRYDVASAGSVDEIIQRAKNADVQYMLNIGTKLDDVEQLQQLSERYSYIFRTVGIHPLEARDHCAKYSEHDITRIISDHAPQQVTVGIGEIGLDYHYDKEGISEQQQLFHLQLDLAEQFHLPVSIHSRDAFEDTVAILRAHPQVTGVMHCFSGDKDFARQVLDLGYYVSFSGVITYKKATDIQEAAQYVPLDRILIETDSPFLAPVPHRGKANEPAFVTFVAQKIAELTEQPLEVIANHSSENFFSLFPKATR